MKKNNDIFNGLLACANNQIEEVLKCLTVLGIRLDLNNEEKSSLEDVMNDMDKIKEKLQSLRRQ